MQQAQLFKRHWGRWIKSSIVNYLKEVANSEQIASLVAGVEDRTTEFLETPHRVEIRTTGPLISTADEKEYELRVFVNCLVTSNFEEKTDRYIIDRYLGVFCEALDQPIPIYKCGPDPQVDDGTCINCLHVYQGSNLGVRVINFNQPDENDRVRQGMATAAYTVTFNAEALNRTPAP